MIDVGQAFVKSSGDKSGANLNQGTVSRLDDNSSYIGFKGSEDLGNGLKAIFQYESAFSGDSAGGLTGGRDTYVGLNGGFGTVVAGTITHPLRAMFARTEILPGATGFGSTASLVGQMGGTKTGADDRAKNLVGYVTPTFSGFSGTIAYINGENKTNDTTGANATKSANTRAYQFAAQYENGPVWVAAGYHRVSDYGAIGSKLDTLSGGNARIVRVAATYTLPSKTKLAALFDNTKVDIGTAALGAIDGAYLKRSAWSIGVSQPFGNNTVGIEYAKAGKINASGDKADGTGAHLVTALYSYSLSKRTMLQARYSRLSNGEKANYNFYTNPVASNGVNTGASLGAAYTGYMFGIRHTF